jgi:hypothetical protein
MKIYEFTRQSLPFEPGFNDILAVKENQKEFRKINCRTWPNAYRPSDNAPCYAAYAAPELGEYRGWVNETTSHGKHIVFNDGLAIPSIWPNPNQKWQKIIKEVLFHKSAPNEVDPHWPGSMACFTAEDPDYSNVMNLVSVGENVLIRVIGTKLVIGLYSPTFSV